MANRHLHSLRALLAVSLLGHEFKLSQKLLFLFPCLCMGGRRGGGEPFHVLSQSCHEYQEGDKTENITLSGKSTNPSLWVMPQPGLLERLRPSDSDPEQ